ncbi:MAG: acyl-CoA dehydrogenase family protein [Patulibacter sp.]
MHQFTIATLVEVTKLRSGMEWLVIESVARQNLLVASGFAEGSGGGHVLRPTMKVRRDIGGYRISGVKRPCSLSSSMDMLAVSMLVSDHPDGEQFAVALVSARDPGMSVLPFWRSPVLGGAETNEVILADVDAPESVVSYAGSPDDLDTVQIRGYLWFQLLIASAYVGVASRLVAMGLDAAGPEASDAIAAVAALETAISALEGAGAAFEADHGDDESLLARVLLVRHGVEDLVVRASDLGLRLVGARGFAASGDAAVLLASCRALSWHPPSRERALPSLASYLSGAALTAF